MTRSLILLILPAVFAAASSRASNCASTSTGFFPLTELTGTYHGYPGGLYPGGVNFAPSTHDSAGQRSATSFVPLDSMGNIDLMMGKWVLLSVGMSNTTQEFSTFIADIAGDTTLNPHLRLVDGAQGAQTAEMIKYDTATYWTVCDSRLTQAHLSPLQVQAVWIKEANRRPSGGFPSATIKLRDDVRDVLQVIKRRYPNCRQVFFSSRIYAGYATASLNPEPYAYESAFACRWLIESQIDGNDSLNYDPARGMVTVPWLAWGPYLWADGIVPRQLDGLTYACEDFVESDGTHPSASGRAKVSDLLKTFFKTSPYTTPWFLKAGSAQACCVGGRGNIDCDASDQIDIADLTALIDNLFIGFTPLCCNEEANCDGFGEIDVSDVTTLIDNLFVTFTLPLPCP